MVGGRVGAGITAEIGAMQVTEQVDAIRSMGADPVQKLVLPRVLAELTAGTRNFEAEGATLQDVLLDLGTRRPTLMVHFFDAAQKVRPHIICLHGDTYVRAGDIAGHKVCDGDEIQIINALAGG